MFNKMTTPKNVVVAISVSFICFFMVFVSCTCGDNIRQVTLLYCEPDGWLGRHAAEEFAEYAKKLGIRTALSSESESSRDKIEGYTVIISRPESSKIISKFIDKNLISNDIPDNDGFIIKSIERSNKRYLIITASQDRALLYGVYHYLENVCGIGFFEDGDYIPEGKTLVLDDIDIKEEPRFEIRGKNCGIGHWALRKYHSFFWNFAQWKEYLDWMAKKKLNMFTNIPLVTYTGFSETAVQKVFPDIGPPVAEAYYLGNGEWPAAAWNWPAEYREDLMRRVLDYARKLGFETIYTFQYAQVPVRYVRAHPERKYVMAQKYRTPQLHPDDPLSLQYTKDYIKEINKVFDTDHYYMCSPYAEEALDGDALRVKIKAAKDMFSLLKEVDSKAVWVTDTWDYLANGAIWTKENVKKYLSEFPDDRMLIYETGSDAVNLREEHNYFWGKPWVLGVLHALGGDDELHGDLNDLISRVQKVEKEPKAGNCKGVFMVSETNHHNTIYYDLVTQLAWNPKSVSIDDYLQDYAVKRYGAKSASIMYEVLAKLRKTVYTGKGFFSEAGVATKHQNLPYYHRLNEAPLFDEREQIAKERLQRHIWQLKLLEECMLLSLQEKKLQQGNLLYENDMVVLATTYLGKLSNCYLLKTFLAFKKGEQKLVESNAQKALVCLDEIEKILSTRFDYSLKAMIEDVMSVPGSNPYLPEMIKQACISSNYCTNEVYEQLVFFYHPKVEAYLSEIQSRAKKGNKSITLDDLDTTFKTIADIWIKNSLEVDPQSRYSGKTLNAIEESFEKMRNISMDKIT